MGIFGKLFKGPEIDQAKSADSKQKMRRLFDSVVPDGGQYQLVAAYTEDAKRFNYGLVHGSKTTYGSLIVGWKEGADPTVVVVPTVPDLSGCGDPEICPRSAVKKAYQNKYPTDAFIIYPDGRHYLAINTFEWLEDEKLFIYVDQDLLRHEVRSACHVAFPGAGRCRPAGPGDSLRGGTPLVCTGGDGEGCYCPPLFFRKTGALASPSAG